MNIKFIVLFFIMSGPYWCLGQQLQEKKIHPAKLTEAVKNIIQESDQQIIASIGKHNFMSWLDSIAVYEIPFDNGCNGVRRPCDPVPARLSDNGRIRITYFLNIPGFGSYKNSNFAYLNGRSGKMILENRSILPDCKNNPFKCRFIPKDALLVKARELLRVSDTSQFRFHYSFYYSGNFAYFFQAKTGSLTLSANTGEVLEYKYFGPFRSNDCAVTEQCRFDPKWLKSAEKFLGINDTFKLLKAAPTKRGYSCAWELTSPKAYLVLNGKDGTILNYTNYAGPSADYRKPSGSGK